LSQQDFNNQKLISGTAKLFCYCSNGRGFKRKIKKRFPRITQMYAEKKSAKIREMQFSVAKSEGNKKILIMLNVKLAHD
jgi:hypothetical protein